MKILQINTVINSGSTGHIAETIGLLSIDNGFESYIAFGRNPKESASKSYKIGSKVGFYYHAIMTRLFDLQGCCSYIDTLKMIRYLKKLKPDVVHLHNIHGYYLNIKLLFHYLYKFDIPVVWTLHDCWSYTGHCAYYSYIKCNKWSIGCNKCPNKNSYPATILFSRAKKNYELKKSVFTLLKEEKVCIVSPSTWLQKEVANSFLNKYKSIVIHNGVDTKIFYPRKRTIEHTVILGVASKWERRKGLDDFIQLSNLLNEDEKIVLIGVTEEQKRYIPDCIQCILRTENQEELAQWYSDALVFVNPTYEDNFPTTNLEAQACGTPVITYDTDGSPETVCVNTGFVIKKGDISQLYKTIQTIKQNTKSKYTEECVSFARKVFDKDKNFLDYLKVYRQITSQEE